MKKEIYGVFSLNLSKYFFPSTTKNISDLICKSYCNT